MADEAHVHKTLTPGFHDVARAHMSDLPGFSKGIVSGCGGWGNARADELERWFSASRMQRYLGAVDPVALYAWDNRLSKAYLADVAHVEVLLRNFMSERLASASLAAFEDERWFEHPRHFNLSQRFVERRDEVAERILAAGHAVTVDRMTAGLGLGTWLFMLARSQEPTVWKALRDAGNGGMPNYRTRSRADFRDHVEVIWRLRNRCAHHEHVCDIDKDVEADYLDGYSFSIDWVAKAIDPRAAQWIAENSRVAEIRRRRPE